MDFFNSAQFAFITSNAGGSETQGAELQLGGVETDARQNLDGNTRPNAPKWSGFVAADYERPISATLVLGITANMQFKGSMALIATDPAAKQSA